MPASRTGQRMQNRNTVQPIRKVSAILYADVVGYSRLMGADELATIDDLLTTRELMAGCVAVHRGRIVNTAGDSVLAEFPDALDSLRCAVNVQQQLADFNRERPSARRMQLRIGLNLGDIFERDAELYGDAVNIAARLEAICKPGGICVSSSIHEVVEGRLPLAFSYAGEQQLKNVARPVSVYHVRIDADAPDATEAQQGQPAATAAAVRRTLPAPLSSFIGRAAEMRAVVRLLGDFRLVTLVGPGGVGKTRLAVQVAEAIAQGYVDGCWFVELAPLSDPRRVAAAIAKSLGIAEQPGRALDDVLIDALHERRALLVLDNCEHLLQACADLASRLLAYSREVRLLCTSREPLRVNGEVNYPVPVLSLPAAGGALAMRDAPASEAVRLFVDRARAARPDFVLGEQVVHDVVQICRRLDGIALAIELAAARVRTLPVHTIAARLDDCFRLLSEGTRDALPHHRTLRALIDWSHDLLGINERVLFRRLAVFAGGWTLDAAEAVGAGGEVPAHDVADLLGRLVEKSLVEMAPGGDRYALLQTVRAYAEERLAQAGEADAVRTRHLDYYLAQAESARPGLAGVDQVQWLCRLDAELENMLAAHRWCDFAANGGPAGLRLIDSLKRYLFNRGLLQTLWQAVVEALARAGAAPRDLARCHAAHAAGQAAYRLGRHGEATTWLTEALSIARDLGDDARAASVMQELGMNALAQGERDSARRRLEDAVELARRSGDKRELASAVNAVAQVYRMDGDLDAAQPLYEQALELMRELQDRENLAVAALNLALVAIARGDGMAARRMLAQACGAAETLQSRLIGQYVLAVASALAALDQDWLRAASIYGASIAEAERTAIQFDPADLAVLEPLWQQLRAACSPAAFSAAESAGREQGYVQALSSVGQWLRQEVGAPERSPIS